MSGRIPWSFLAPQLILFVQCKQEHMKKLNFYPISIMWEWHQNGTRKHRWHRTYAGTSQGPFECKPFLQYIVCAYIPPLNSEHWPVSPERQDCSGRSPTCCTLPGESSRRAAALRRVAATCDEAQAWAGGNLGIQTAPKLSLSLWSLTNLQQSERTDSLFQPWSLL